MDISHGYVYPTKPNTYYHEISSIQPIKSNTESHIKVSNDIMVYEKEKEKLSKEFLWLT